jgi:hypothetical protein
MIDEFYERLIPQYAILSHIWGDEEVTWQDMKEGRAESLKGYRKITACCDQARYDGLAYVVSLFGFNRYTDIFWLGGD